MSSLNGITFNGIPLKMETIDVVDKIQCAEVLNIIKDATSKRNIRKSTSGYKYKQQIGENGEIMTISKKAYLSEKYAQEIQINRVRGLEMIKSKDLKFAEKVIISLMCSDQSLSITEIEKEFTIRNMHIGDRYIYGIMSRITSTFPTIKQIMVQSIEPRFVNHKKGKNHDRLSKVFYIPSEFCLIFAEGIDSFKKFIHGQDWDKCFSNHEHVQLLHEICAAIEVDEIPEIPSIKPVVEEPVVEEPVVEEPVVENKPAIKITINLHINISEGILKKLSDIFTINVS